MKRRSCTNLQEVRHQARLVLGSLRSQAPERPPPTIPAVTSVTPTAPERLQRHKSATRGSPPREAPWAVRHSTDTTEAFSRVIL